MSNTKNNISSSLRGKYDRSNLNLNFIFTAFLFFIFTFYTHITFAQNTEKQIVIGEITFSGNKKTKEKILSRELTFKTGDTISKQKFQSQLLEIKQNIENTLLFIKVDLDTVLTPQNVYKITVKVQERWYFWPYPILEHADRNFSSFLQNQDLEKVNYGLFFQQNNFRGRNEILKFKIRLGYKEQFAINYIKPYLNQKQTLGLEVHSNYFRQKEIAFSTFENKLKYFKSDDYIQTYWENSLTLKYRHKLYNKFNFTVSNFDYNLADTIINLNANYLFKNQKSTSNIVFEANYIRENRNSIIYPLTGKFFKFQVEQNLGLNTDFAKTTFQINYNAYAKLCKKMYFASGVLLNYSLQNSDDYIFSKALGYENNIRGFEYYVIDGQSFAVVKNNLKIELFKKENKNLPIFNIQQFEKIHYASYLNLFFDFANVYNQFPNTNNYMDNTFIYSVGLGLDLVTYYDKILRIEYSYNNFKIGGLYLNFVAPI